MPLPIPALLAALAFAGCASQHASEGSTAWRAEDLAKAPVASLVLHSEGGRHRSVAGPAMRELLEVKRRVEAAAGDVSMELLIVARASPAGMITRDEGQWRMLVSTGMLDLLEGDRDAFAALVGHELAHAHMRHAEQRRERRRSRDDTDGLVAFALSVVGIPLGATLADAAGTVLERSYSRDEEREADRLGQQYLRRAGYDPYGAVRLQERLAGGGEAALPFLSTHPTGSERVEAMRRFAAEEGK